MTPMIVQGRALPPPLAFDRADDLRRRIAVFAIYPIPVNTRIIAGQSFPKGWRPRHFGTDV